MSGRVWRSPKAKRKLCKRGYEAAKKRYAVYPSAYANAYAVQVCRGQKPDAQGKRRADQRRSSAGKRRLNAGLRRWFAEQWVNVCVPGFPACGRSQAKKSNYPYCRPLKRINKSTPKTVGELGSAKLAKMCSKKRAGKRVYV